jgi:transketolase
VKPLDEKAIASAAKCCGVIITAEEHQTGGLGNLVAAAIGRSAEVYGTPVIMGMIGVQDRFGESGAPWELMKEFELSAEHIAAKAKKLHDLKLSRG